MINATEPYPPPLPPPPFSSKLTLGARAGEGAGHRRVQDEFEWIAASDALHGLPRSCPLGEIEARLPPAPRCCADVDPSIIIGGELLYPRPRRSQRRDEVPSVSPTETQLLSAQCAGAGPR
jgi:hypothetical protein